MDYWIISLGIALTWASTALGAASVYIVHVTDKLRIRMEALMGFAAGVMISAAVFGLIMPGLDSARTLGQNPLIISAVGFLSGVAFLLILDKVLPHFHDKTNVQEGMHTRMQRSMLMMVAVTIHNIPEGMAVGVAFGAALLSGEPGAVMAALGLSVGMAIQNVPEGAAVSLSLLKSGMQKRKAFRYGQLSGVVEPIFALLGLFIASRQAAFMPFLLCFSAGAMMYVVVEELIPESQAEGHSHAATIGTMVGFVIMMMLDVAFG